MISGSPPTDRNARTGLFTPPTRTFSAHSKISRERRRSRFKVGWIALIDLRTKLSRLQPTRDILGMVRQDNAGSGALDARQNFNYDALLVEPVFLHGGFHHGEFAAHVVSGHRHVEAIAPLTNAVEIWQARLHHHDVGTLVQVQRDFLERFAAIGGVHLIAAAVTQPWGRVPALPGQARQT